MCEKNLGVSEKSLNELTAEKRREYKRQWNAKNRDKCKIYTKRYWRKKVMEELVHKGQELEGGKDVDK